MLSPGTIETTGILHGLHVLPPNDSGGPSVTAAERLYRSLAPVVFGAVWLTARLAGMPADVRRARAGILPPVRPPLLWFHGASAGEVGAAVKLAALLRSAGYVFTAGYTSTTRAGLECVARAAAPCVAALSPWDLPRWVERAFDAWKPTALFLIETELWPTLILEAARRAVPVFCASARVYPRDVWRYRAIRWLIGPTLRRVSAVLAQNDAERRRFLAIGAAPERCLVAGNLKHLATEQHSAAMSLRAAIGLRDADMVVVCGSLHRDELEPVCAAMGRWAVPNLRIILAPRQLSACTAALAAAARQGWKVHRRTAGAPPSDWDVLVLDTMGELPGAYALGTVAIVGGGFGRHGGHNPLEPIASGVPVVVGRHFDHFRQEAIALTAVTPEAQVQDAEELGRRVGEWLIDRGLRERIVRRQRTVLPDPNATARRYLRVLSPWLSGVRA